MLSYCFKPSELTFAAAEYYDVDLGGSVPPDDEPNWVVYRPVMSWELSLTAKRLYPKYNVLAWRNKVAYSTRLFTMILRPFSFWATGSCPPRQRQQVMELQTRQLTL